MRLLLLLLVPVSLLVSVASAPSAFAADTVEPVTPTGADTRTRFWGIDAGLRVGFLTDSSFDPYSTNDALRQGSIGVTRTSAVRGGWSFAPGARWDVGSATARTRGADVELVVHRLTIPLEGRHHLWPWLYVFGRLAPGVVWQRASVKDASLAEPLRASGWSFAADASIGASILLLSTVDSPTTRAPRMWLTPEIGYGWSTPGPGVLAPATADDDPQTYGSIALSRVAVRGVFFRVGMTFTF